jgi:hypothetical protein
VAESSKEVHDGGRAAAIAVPPGDFNELLAIWTHFSRRLAQARCANALRPGRQGRRSQRRDHPQNVDDFCIGMESGNSLKRPEIASAPQADVTASLTLAVC